MSEPTGRVLCVGAVVRRNDRVLVVRQADGHPLEGQWTIPWGTVKSGESPSVAAVRESLEEGGVDVTVEGLLGIQDLPESGWLAILFLCRYTSGDPTPDGRETDAAAFLDRGQIEEFEESFEPWSRWLVLEVLAGRHGRVAERSEHPYSPLKGFL